VERGDAARGGARGGGSIQAASQVRARVGAAVASLLVAAGVDAAVALSADEHRLALAGIGGLALLLLAAALGLAWPSLVPWPIVVLAGAYAWELGDGGLDQWAPLYAGALLAIAELTYWSLELRGRSHDAERLNERRAALIAVLALLAVLAGALVLSAAAVRIGSGLGTDVAGVAAAVAGLAVVAAVARPRA
jgi:hypothetical protein